MLLTLSDACVDGWCMTISLVKFGHLRGVAVACVPLNFFFFIFPIAGSKYRSVKGSFVKAAGFWRRASGRSEAESLYKVPALRRIGVGKMKGRLFQSE